MILRLLYVAVAALTLSGCATAPVNCNSSNNDASLIAKVQCDHSGGYSAQIRQREQELMDARAENELFRRVYEEITEQQQATSQTLEVQRQRQASLEQALNSLLNQLKGRHANVSLVQQQIATLEQDLLRSPASGGSAADTAARELELKSLQQKVSRLQLSLGYE